MKPVRDFFESFTWTPPVPGAWLVLLTVAASLLMAIALAGQGRAAKRRWLLPVLWILRTAAVAAVALALAGPSQKLTRRDSSRQAVSIIVDASGSMSLTDPDGFVPDWTLGQPDDPARGALAAARHHLERLESMPPAQWRSAAAVERLRDAVEAIRAAGRPSPLLAAAGQLDSAADELSDGRGLIVNELVRTISEVRGAVEAALHSMDREPVDSGASAEGPARPRLARISEWLAAGELESGWLKACRREFDVTITALERTAVPAGESVRNAWLSRRPDEGPQVTDLAAALDGAAREAGPGRTRAVVLVTDGCHNAAAAAEEAAARLRGLPFFVVPAGAVAGRRRQDLDLSWIAAPASSYLHDTVRIEAVLSGAGCEGAVTDVVLREGDREIDRRQVRIKDGIAEPKIAFEWKPERVGRHTLKVDAVPMANEITVVNNRQEAGIDILDDTLRVMLADREPRWETRYLLNLLKRDQRMEFRSLLFAPAHTAGSQSPAPPAFPFQIDEWARYRVVLLGDVGPEQLTVAHQDLLTEFVTKRGGTLILMAGSAAMPAAFAGQPLASLLPVTARAFDSPPRCSVALTAEGRELDSMRLAADADATAAVWRDTTGRLPLTGLSPWSVAKPQAHVLLNAVPLEGGGERAFLTWQNAGRGRVIYLASPETWHLRYLAGDRWHYQFWGQLLHWAVARDLAGGSRCVHLSLDRNRVPQDSPVNVRLRLEDTAGRVVSGAAPRAVVRMADTTERSVLLTEDTQAPGTYAGLLSGLSTGPCRVAVEGPEIDRLLREEEWQGRIETPLVVDPPDNREMRHVLRDGAQIRRIAAAAEGAVLPPRALPHALRNLGLRPAIFEETELRPLWNEWRWLWLILGLLTLEWILRKPAGLL